MPGLSALRPGADTVARPRAGVPGRERWCVPDLFKALGCVLIVLHHLAFYGPMADVVATAWPGVIGWLHDQARLVVQVFLVVAGFLGAQGLQAAPASHAAQALHRVGRRYLRLSLPLLAALSFTVLVSELLRPGFAHESLSAPPGWWQVLAHVALLQHVLDLQALSAGVWYVAIDLQLYALAVGLAWLTTRCGGGLYALQAVWLLITLGSLLWWNRLATLDDWAPYFAGAYGMGVLAALARLQVRGAPAWRAGLGILALGALSWWVAPRERLLLACMAAAALALVPQVWMQGPPGRWRAPVDLLARISYSVFVLHFGVCLAVNAVFSRWLPQTVPVQALGMGMALLLSLWAGAQLQRWTEQPPPSLRRWAWLSGGFVASSALSMWLAA